MINFAVELCGFKGQSVKVREIVQKYLKDNYKRVDFYFIIDAHSDVCYSGEGCHSLVRIIGNSQSFYKNKINDLMKIFKAEDIEAIFEVRYIKNFQIKKTTIN